MQKQSDSMKTIILFLTTILYLYPSIPVFGQQKDLNFDAAYKKQNDQKVTIEINELQELAYIILSLTDIAKNNKVMTDQGTEYYREIIAHFTPYAGHEVVHKFNTLLSENIINYFILAGNAYGFRFEKDKIVPTGIYNFPAKGVGKFEAETNPIITYINDLEDFAKKSKFRKFYKDHNRFYNDLKKEYHTFAAIDEQKKWLEKEFDYNINSYRVLTSPLIGGMNATHTFEDNDFKETLLFLPTIKKDKEWTENYRKAINTRIIFTEIDHNYVGPVSENNKEKINSIFDNRAKWVDSTNRSTQHYPTPVKVFDEYLTWGLFLLYAHDLFPDDQVVFNQMVENVNTMMISKKGFPKAKEFNEELLKLYMEHKDKGIASLYAPLLEWSARQ
ncbi:Uncharacterised protein [Sphingobacterium spiritivorum]|uniref:DUF4932 domain-containing protein n=2 Tax=Sphingobacterium spiritivorum TaxID=258 RepID=D7VIF3_SPHSI|nr:hypothetical protein HMPREF0766_10772 [Sphingobacterium spiritivorum ATCC 33861]SUI97126.1 Uncharacterised protein [Sphingobacterium spiritivorum]